MTASIDPRRTVGSLGEQIAADHLRRAGYVILARNFRTRFGELDLVVANQRCIVFCEVKSRIAGTRRGPRGPLDAIGPRKRAQVRVMAREWLTATTGERPHRPELRFDAIGVLLSRSGALVSLNHVENAF